MTNANQIKGRGQTCKVRGNHMSVRKGKDIVRVCVCLRGM